MTVGFNEPGYLDWEEPQEFVDFVVEQLEDARSWLFEGTLGGETEELLRKTLKQRKKERDSE